MTTNSNQKISVDALIDSPISKVWELWTEPAHIIKWNHASEDWHTTKAENDLRIGGAFSSRMEAKDGSFGFDFGGTYDQVESNKLIAYTMSDGRQVSVSFNSRGDSTQVTEIFDAENQNSHDLQKQGWQAILDNFKKYCETFK